MILHCFMDVLSQVLLVRCFSQKQKPVGHMIYHEY